jgi:two-component system, NtrC family, response regulator AtoC
MDLPPTMRTEEDPASRRLSVVVIQPDSVVTHPLPESGALTVGRADDCTIRLDDPQISRVHARLWVEGGKIEVEDLESANGTRVRGRRLDAGERTEVHGGEVIEVGATMLVLQNTSHRDARRRLASHAYFEVRLEEECARNARTRRSPFAVVRVTVLGSIDQVRLEHALTRPLGRNDFVACYAPGEYELLLPDSAGERVEHVGAEIRTALAEFGCSARIGAAGFPEDGLTPDALMSAANAELLGPSVAPPDSAIVIEDESMRDLYRVIDRVAAGRISVLLLGETGVGKEIVAEAVHRRSTRKDAPFVRLNCAALSETLVESELFGHEKGAFTGADRARAGLLEAAHGGTLFLDEIGELSLNTQAKLLRVLEVREVRRVGGSDSIAVDVRFVSATNRDLEKEIERGGFRQDLFYRLAGVSLSIPPLRDRKHEIVPLARSFAARAAADLGVASPRISEDAEARLSGYAWPGNIRELRNVVERAVLLSEGRTIEPIHLPLDKLSTAWSATGSDGVDAAEPERRRRIVEALDECAGNQTRAAQKLGVSRQTLSKWLSRYDIARPRKG